MHHTQSKASFSTLIDYHLNEKDVQESRFCDKQNVLSTIAYFKKTLKLCN